MSKLFTFLTLCLMLYYISCHSHQYEENNEGSSIWNTLNGEPPIIIAHRGESGKLPDHTIQGYTLAIDLGADYIEPDLVLTKDHVLIARHEPMLSLSTNVASFPEFADRKTTKLVDGVPYTDWFAGDFTLEEIKKLGAIQIIPERPQQYNGLFQIPTFEEVIALAKEKSIETGRTIGVYPETKHPTFHEQNDLPITDVLLDDLEEAGWNNKHAPVFVQSFEVSNLQYVRERSTVKITQLLDATDVDKNGNLIFEGRYSRPYDFNVSGDPRTYGYLATDEGLDFLKTYATVVAPWKPYIIPYGFIDENDDGVADDLNGDGVIDSRDYYELPATDLIERAHKKGLLVHAWTFMNEPKYLLSNYSGDPREEYLNWYRLGIDGLWSDFTETAITARDIYEFTH